MYWYVWGIGLESPVYATMNRRAMAIGMVPTDNENKVIKKRRQSAE